MSTNSSVFSARLMLCPPHPHPSKTQSLTPSLLTVSKINQHHVKQQQQLHLKPSANRVQNEIRYVYCFKQSYSLTFNRF